MTKAYYIDTFSTNHLHEMFNASSLQMFAEMYDRIEYRASRSSYEHVLQLIGNLPENVNYRPLPVINAYKGWKRLRFLLKQLQALMHNVFFILFVPKEYDILFNYNTLAALPAMNKAARCSRNRILQICHGEMTELDKPYSKNRLLRRGVCLLQNGKNIPDNMYFAVLGKAIYKNVYPFVGNEVQKKLLYFEHSAVFPQKNVNVPTTKDKNKLIIGTIGAMRESKGESSLIQLAQMFKDHPNVEIRCLGKYTLPKQTIDAANIVIPNSICGRYLTREELYEQISQLDYALFLFPPDLYRFTASGSIFDAIACGVPVLSLTNDYFEGLFDAYGAFGFLEPNLTALVKRISLLADNSATKPEWKMQSIRAALSPIRTAKQFEQQWLPKRS